MAYELKGGATTQDPRLDRIPEFDDRSRQYPIRTLLDTSVPLRSYTWRCAKWLDQGREGACVGFAYTHDLAARPSEVLTVTNSQAIERYHAIQHEDPWTGCFRGHEGGRYDGTSVLSGAAIMKKTGWYREYRWAFGIDDVVRTLAFKGPVILGINWYTGMYNTDSKGYIYPTGQLAGGHAIMARAYNHTKGRITLRNSWGQDWGVNGDCYITVEDLDTLLQQDGEACVPQGRRTTPVPSTA